jgi:hypothetical protein
LTETLGGAQRSRFGHTPGLGTFWPGASAWSQAVLTRARWLVHNASQAALALRALAFVEARADALEAVRPTLVHGSLQPLHLRADAEGGLAEVGGWWSAHFGDPLEDWVRFALGPAALAHAFLEGRSLDDKQIGRLEVYCALHLLDRLRSGRPLVVARRTMVARQQLHALEHGFVRARVERTPAPPLPATPRIHALTMSLLAAAGHCQPETIEIALGGISACLLAQDAAAEGKDARATALVGRAVEALALVQRAGEVHTSGSAQPVAPTGSRGHALRWLRSRLRELDPPAAVESALDRAAVRLQVVDDVATAGLARALPQVRQVHRVVEGVIVAADLRVHPPAETSDPVAEVVAAYRSAANARGTFDAAVDAGLDTLIGAKLLPNQWVLFTYYLAAHALWAGDQCPIPPDVALPWFGVGRT